MYVHRYLRQVIDGFKKLYAFLPLSKRGHCDTEKKSLKDFERTGPDF